MEELKAIITEIMSYEKFGFKPSHDQILDTAGRIFNSQNINNQKRENIREIKEIRKFQEPTKNQIWMINKLCSELEIPKPKEYSKKEAIEIIKNLLEKKKDLEIKDTPL